MSKVIYEVGAEDLSLDDAPRSGRPVEVNDQTKTLTENSQRYTMKEKADILEISGSKIICISLVMLLFVLMFGFHISEKKNTNSSSTFLLKCKKKFLILKINRDG